MTNQFIQAHYQAIGGSAEKADEVLRLTLIKWLEYNDRNGCYSDEDCDAEGLNRLTVIDALQCVLDQHLED